MGRQHSVTNGCFGEAKLQRPLSGSELEKWAVVSRPRLGKNDGTIFKLLAVFIAIRVEEPKVRC
jgi:hypothetical protein